jgi:hypothetical protein
MLPATRDGLLAAGHVREQRSAADESILF